MKKTEDATHEAKLNRLSLARKDLREAQVYLSAFRVDLHPTVQRALLVAAIISYARPFRGGWANRTQPIAPKVDDTLGEGLSDAQQDLHILLLRYRDKAIAHSDFELKPTGRISTSGLGVATWTLPFDLLSLDLDVAEFLAIVREWEIRCTAKLLELGGTLNKLDQVPAVPLGIEMSDGVARVHAGEMSLTIPLSAFSQHKEVP